MQELLRKLHEDLSFSYLCLTSDASMALNINHCDLLIDRHYSGLNQICYEAIVILNTLQHYSNA